jgi:hypothetical protein
MSTLDQAMFNICKKSLKEKVHQLINDNLDKDHLKDIFQEQYVPRVVDKFFENEKLKVIYEASSRANPDDDYESALSVILKITDTTTSEFVYIALKGWWSSYNGNEYQDQWSFVEPKTKVVTYYE